MNTHRLYTDRAAWWPLFSEKGYYREEAANVLQALRDEVGGPVRTILELGCGGGSLAFHTRPHTKLTLVDLSTDMLGVSRKLNAGVEHVQGDMRTVRLSKRFHAVVIHDAINYMTTPEDIRAALETARLHLEADGVVIVLPDDTRETFTPRTGTGGQDRNDGRGLRYLSWTAPPEGNTYTMDFGLLLRDRDGSIEILHERHLFGLFSLDEWCAAFCAAGLSIPAIRADRLRAHVFVSRLRLYPAARRPDARA